MAQPEISILVSSFERPAHVCRVLASIAAQRGVSGAFEVVVTDDGSRDETPRLVRQFAASANFPVRFTTHPHGGFHIARCRNEGVAAATAPYLLFLDGDCMIPTDHIKKHLDRRRPGHAMAGYPIYFNQSISEKITPEDARHGHFEHYVKTSQRLQTRWWHARAVLYSLLRDPKRPKLLGGNLGIARADYERINGYDENFHGWGCEDDDLRARLCASGIQVASIAWWTHTYHLWHPRTPSAPQTWKAGANVKYFERPLRLTRCIAGLQKRRLQDLHIEIVGRRANAAKHTAKTLSNMPLWFRAAASTSRPGTEPPEIEVAFSTADKFSTRSNSRVLVLPHGQTPSPALAKNADLIFTDGDAAALPKGRAFPLSSFNTVMQQQLGFLSQDAAATSVRSIAA